MPNRINNYAKKSFLALLNPEQSVKKVYPNAIDQITDKKGYFLGSKEVQSIPLNFIARLAAYDFHHHTIDKASHSGRGIDLALKNPITGRPMTGSSSGTAVNVFLGINDLGVGTDGGGSVLGPAMSLNLYGFIHPDLGKDYQVQPEAKMSTDGIAFSPAIGLISRDFYLLESLLANLFQGRRAPTKELTICLDQEAAPLTEGLSEHCSEVVTKRFEKKYTGSRQGLIAELQELLVTVDVLISKEGPVDLTGIGDTVFGHFDERTRTEQIKANKGFIRVVNMAGGIALTIPTKELATAYVLISKNTPSGVANLCQIAREILPEEDQLIQSYFGDLSKYFENGI